MKPEALVAKLDWGPKRRNPRESAESKEEDVGVIGSEREDPQSLTLKAKGNKSIATTPDSAAAPNPAHNERTCTLGVIDITAKFRQKTRTSIPV